ncbi:arsenite methyltransferase [Lapillicoccus sp.]|uniref:arsenite methyltransferase n=1 Tax=Lapillicoccus sp. TaxID=1909287 RepID=UPI0032633735
MATADEVREEVRSRYAAAAVAVTHGQHAGCGETGSCTDPSCCTVGSRRTADPLVQDESSFGSSLYLDRERGELPEAAVLASLGCGNPVAVADLHPGERVLDLGCGGGIDVLLSAKRVGPGGYAYGVDMTDEMLDLARANAAEAGASNVEFLKGTIEDVPLPDGSVDVVISNCVINLSADKPAVLAEMFRVLAPGGRIGIADVVAEDHLTEADRIHLGSFTGCIAGALSRQEYLHGLATAGFAGGSVDFTHQAVPQMHGAIIRAVKPAAAPTPMSGSPVREALTLQAAPGCCSTDQLASCCEPDAKADCCGSSTGAVAPSSCGCR